MTVVQMAESELAAKYNAESIPDDARGPNYNSYKLNGCDIWECVHNGHWPSWAVAKLVDNHFTNHQYFKQLEDAFKFAINS